MMRKFIRNFVVIGVVSLLFILTGCSNSANSEVTDQKINEFLVSYYEDLADTENKIMSYEEESKSFVGLEVFLVEKQDANYVVYVWIFQESYFKVNETTISISGGYSTPCKVVIKDNGGKYEVISSEMPGDSETEAEDIMRLFPVDVQKRLDTLVEDGTLDKLIGIVEEKALSYFGAEFIDYCPECDFEDIDE